jgi:hypothetical protein
MKKMKREPTDRKKYLQIMYLIRDLYLDYIRNSHSSIIRRQPNLKMDRRAEG